MASCLESSRAYSHLKCALCVGEVLPPFLLTDCKTTPPLLLLAPAAACMRAGSAPNTCERVLWQGAPLQYGLAVHVCCVAGRGAILLSATATAATATAAAGSGGQLRSRQGSGRRRLGGGRGRRCGRGGERWGPRAALPGLPAVSGRGDGAAAGGRGGASSSSGRCGEEKGGRKGEERKGDKERR